MTVVLVACVSLIEMRTIFYRNFLWCATIDISCFNWQNAVIMYEKRFLKTIARKAYLQYRKTFEAFQVECRNVGQKLLSGTERKNDKFYPVYGVNPPKITPY